MHWNRILCHYCIFTFCSSEPVLKDVAAAGAAECISRIYKHSSDVGALRQAARLGRHLSRQSMFFSNESLLFLHLLERLLCEIVLTEDNKELMATNQRLENAVYALEKHHPKDLIVAQHCK